MIDSEHPQICRLCLLNTDDYVNIWELFEDSSIASILGKHFWFQVHKNDGLTEWICQICWIQTKTFHEFYKKVEQYQKSLWDSVDIGSCELDAKEIAGVDNVDAAHETDLNVVKCEETELISTTIDSQNTQDDSSDDEIDNKDIEQSGTEDVSDEPSIKKLKIDVRDLSDKSKLEGQIHEIFTMKCDICSDVQFESLKEVFKHYRNIHRTNGYLICCDKKYWYRSHILDHIRYHNSKPEAHSEKDEENAQISEFFTMKCEICSDVKFRNLVVARRHYRKVHKTEGYLMCCGKKFQRRDSIRYHVLTHINPDELSCAQCGKILKSKNALKTHVANHAPLDSRAHKCSLCSSSFPKVSILKRHVHDTHSSKTGEKFPCEKCDKNFRSQLLLTGHIRGVHEYSLEHVCETCARRFKSKQILANHIASQHATISQPKVQCDICGSWLKHKLSLHKHFTLMHKDLPAINCSICNKLVRNKARLASHMKNVHGERRHKCTLCDKAFKRAKNLREHIAGHTGENLYNCPYCEKKFKSNGNMYSHRKNAHLSQWTRDTTQRNALENNS